MSSYSVTRCICHKRNFEEIKEFAEQQSFSSVEELQAEQFCSCGCGLCIPYIEMMFETGRTEFEPGEYYKASTE
ncbi:hypothetical protein [Gracilimonas mengyeensis]|uniref:BFD-like [2Fe-2S] binding domain-containing protein n=1 Tax=Gracilimonas mengyeensis TaxID=1302730 RepID=A0A521DVC0_9BACT|nr:hypothetical protein [Gracilimonas mengyeensis]SMO75674.1 hypothetical protein SAMN06265219_109146 [Gracilimonas mengyeensis]